MSVGPLTVKRHSELQAQGVHLHVFYNGEDVTSRCKFADDTPESNGAYLFALNADGKKYIDDTTGEIALEVVHGIEIREGEPFWRTTV